jgi:hypothetical protein
MLRLGVLVGVQMPLQHSPSAVQGIGRRRSEFGRHIGVVDVEVVLVEVLVVVVVVCARQLPPEQLPLQHWPFLVQFLPLRLHPGGSAEAAPMPSDPSAPPTTAAPINLRALPRVRVPSASPMARSSKKLSLAICGLLPARLTKPISESIIQQYGSD